MSALSFLRRAWFLTAVAPIATVAVVAGCDAASAAGLGATADATLAADAATDTAGPAAAGTADAAATADTAGSDAAAADADPGTDAARRGPPAFAEVQSRLFAQSGCANGYCHGGFFAAAEPPDLAALRTEVLAAQSSNPDCGHKAWIVPGKPLDSLLYLKIAPGLAVDCGEKMPWGKDGVSPEVAELVRDWIAAGAP